MLNLQLRLKDEASPSNYLHVFMFSLIHRLMFCVFVSIQFHDKIVLIVVCESLNGQYPLCSNPEVHRMIGSGRGIHCDQRYSG
jgi:hypothetical protein